MELATFDDYVALYGQPANPGAVAEMLDLVNQAVSDRIIPEILADWAAGGVPAEIRLLVLRATRTLAAAPAPGLRSESLGGYSVGYQDVEGLTELLDEDLLAPFTGGGRVYSVATPSATRTRPAGFAPAIPTPPRGWSEPRRFTGYDGPFTPVYEDWPEPDPRGASRTRRG